MVYTAHSHTYTFDYTEEREAVGIISGGTTSDVFEGDYSTIETEFHDKNFPFVLIAQLLHIEVENTEESIDTD